MKDGLKVNLKNALNTIMLPSLVFNRYMLVFIVSNIYCTYQRAL